jgi:hypothetical protein
VSVRNNARGRRGGSQQSDHIRHEDIRRKMEIENVANRNSTCRIIGLTARKKRLQREFDTNCWNMNEQGEDEEEDWSHVRKISSRLHSSWRRYRPSGLILVVIDDDDVHVAASVAMFAESFAVLILSCLVPQLYRAPVLLEIWWCLRFSMFLTLRSLKSVAVRMSVLVCFSAY